MAAKLTLDAAQQRVAQRLDALAEAIRLSRPPGFFRRGSPPPRGMYLWGDVGRGKTLLMNRFFEKLPVESGRRVHFNEFMNDVHARLHKTRKLHRDPVPRVARALASEALIICLDEFEVRDIADAMILGRLFDQLLARRVVMVVTSNIPPRKLYEGGLNRQLFLPFILLLEQGLDIVRLEGNRDYRLGRVTGLNLYVTPLGPDADAALDTVWSRLTDNAVGTTQTLSVLGRSLAIARAAHGVARFSFEELCERPLAAAEYLAIARRYHVLLIDGIPRLGAEKRDAARRFSLLIDTLYDEGVKLVCSADAVPYELRVQECDEFRRTASRLVEMQSVDYVGGAQFPETTALLPAAMAAHTE